MTDPTARVPRLLFSAYACDPTAGSEPAAGWGLFCAAIECADRVWLVTRTNNVKAIADALDPNLRDRVEVIGFDLGRTALAAKRVLPWGTAQIYYLLWQWRLGGFLKELHREHQFTLAHHATFAADWMPCALSKLPDVPFVWGPVGGAHEAPMRAYWWYGLRGSVVEAWRSLVTRILRATFGTRIGRSAAVVIGQNHDVGRRFAGSRVLRIEPHTHAPELAGARAIPSTSQRTIVGVGRLVPWKGWALAIDALAHLPDDFNLEIYGTGPDHGRLQRRAARRKVFDRVTFMGEVDRSAILERLITAFVLIHPSFHDSGGFAIAEAISAGCPVVALDIAGPGTMLRRAGLAPVDPLTPGLARAIARCLEHPEASGDRRAFVQRRFVPLLSEWYSLATTRGAPC